MECSGMLFTVTLRGGSLRFPSPSFPMCKFLIIIFQRAACVCYEPAFELEQNNCKGTMRQFEHQKLTGWKKKITLKFFGLPPSSRTINSVFPLNTLDVPFTAEDKSQDLAPSLGAEEFLNSFSDKSLLRVVAKNSVFMGILQGQVVWQGPPSNIAEEIKIRIGNKAVALQTLQLMGVEAQGKSCSPRKSRGKEKNSSCKIDE